MCRWVRSVLALAAMFYPRYDTAALPTLKYTSCNHSLVEAVSGSYRELPEYEVICSIDGTQQYRTNIVPSTYYNLFCSSIHNINVDDIPAVHTNDVGDLRNYFFIGQCPLPPSSYADIMKHLGVQSTPRFIIRDIDGNIELRRSHLKGLDRINVRTLILYNSGITDIFDDIFQDLAQLRILNLSENKLRIEGNVFQNFKELKTLYMSHCGLSTLPEGLFALPALERLHLERNRLELRSGIFAQLRSLRVLSLSDNSLETLPVDVFAPLVNLRELNLRNNYMITLQAGLFERNNKLIQIEIDSHSFSEKSFREFNVTTGCVFAERKLGLYVKHCS